MEQDCLTTEDLARIAAEGIGSASADAQTHLAACDACKETLAAAIAACDEEGTRPVGPSVARAVLARASRRPAVPVWRRPAAWGALAAAAVLVAVLLPFWRDEAPGKRFTIPAGQAVEGKGEAYAAGAEGLPLLLPEGSRIRVAPGSRIRCLPPQGEERVHVALEAGSLEAEIVSAPRAVRISAPAGEVRVVGTVFTVRALTVHAPLAEGFEAAPILAVEVREGRVELSGTSGGLEVKAGWRGIVRPEERPLLQERAPMTWEQAAVQFGRGWSAPDFARTSGCATLLSWDWTGASSWIDALASGQGMPLARRVAAALVGMTARPEDAERLSGLHDAETDEEIRKILRPHMGRLGIEEKK